MLHYRLYIIGEHGHFTRAIDLDCPNDEEAIQVAREHDVGRPMELWSGARWVATLPPREPAG